MKTTKKLLASILVVIMLIVSAPLQGFVGINLGFEIEAASYNGTCGKNLTWTLDKETGILEIIGTGAMYDYNSYDDASGFAPWSSIRDNIKYLIIGDGVTRIGTSAFEDCRNIKSLTVPTSVTVIGYKAFTACIGIKDIYYSGTEAEWNKIEIVYFDEYASYIPYITFHYHIYNMGDESYSFKNFSDKDSNGHCFGMSVTSSGYYLGTLEKGFIVGTYNTTYSLNDTPAVRKPICYFQSAQGSARNNSIVAGGNYLLTLLGIKNINLDWKEVINYIKDHSYDYKGNLVVAFFGQNGKGERGGHATNFLRYEKINGQDRIYIYDNNFPNDETYIYKASDGTVRQAPHSTFVGAIDTIALMSVPKYLQLMKYYEKSRCFYADNWIISIENATKYEMLSSEGNNQVMFELDEGVTEVKITPLVDNAEFTYMDKTYSFGTLEETEYGVFTLIEENETPSDTDFEIVEKETEKEEAPSYMKYVNMLIELIKAIIEFIKSVF